MDRESVNYFDEINYLAVEFLEEVGVKQSTQKQIDQVEMLLSELIGLIPKKKNWQEKRLLKKVWIGELLNHYQDLLSTGTKPENMA